MANQVMKFVKSMSKETSWNDKEPDKRNNPPNWLIPSAPPESPEDSFSKHTIKVESTLIVRTHKCFDNLNDCFGVLYHWLDNFRGLIESEFLTTSVFLCLGSNLAPRQKSEGRILESQVSSVIFYYALSKHPAVESSWSTSSNFTVNNLDRRTSVDFSVSYKATRMEGTSIEDYFNLQSHPIPNLRVSLRAMKVEVLEDHKNKLVFTRKVFEWLTWKKSKVQI